MRRRHLARALAQIGIRRPILWISTPAQFDARLDLPARLRVYHIVDDYLGYASLNEAQRTSWAERERALIEWADLVVVVSPELMETKGAGNPKFRLLPNAVDAAAYRNTDSDDPRGAGRTAAAAPRLHRADRRAARPGAAGRAGGCPSRVDAGPVG